MSNKNEITRSLVLKMNSHSIIFNWIKNYLWNGKPILQSFNQTLEHYREDTQGIILDITIEDVKKEIIKYTLSLETEAGLNKFINEEKFSCMKKSFKSLMEEIELPFKNKNELQRFIMDNIIPEIAGDKTKHTTQCTAENGEIGDFFYNGIYPSEYKRTSPIFKELSELFMYARNNGIRT
jgi:hypothetical protein